MQRALRCRAVSRSSPSPFWYARVAVGSFLSLTPLALSCQHDELVAAPRPVPTVEVAPALVSGAPATLSLTGTIQPASTTPLSFGVPGTVATVAVQEGDTVERGALIATLVAGSYRDAYSIAKSKQAQADDAYRRLKPMYDNQTLPEVKMVEVEAGREQAKLAASLAAKTLGDTILRAPSRGVVASRSGEPGSTAAPGVPVVTLVDVDNMLAVVPVPETRVAYVNRAVPVAVHVPALDRTFEGSLRDIGVVADPLTRTYSVRVEVPNLDAKLRIGMVATVDLPLHDAARNLVVPTTSLRIDASGHPYVYVLQQGDTLSRRSIEVTGYFREGVSVASGLREGELVVTSGTPMLADGLAVRVASPAEQDQGKR